VQKITAVHLDRQAQRAVPFPEDIAARARDHLVDDPGSGIRDQGSTKDPLPIPDP
jgi:hypothetical protein